MVLSKIPRITTEINIALYKPGRCPTCITNSNHSKKLTIVFKQYYHILVGEERLG